MKRTLSILDGEAVAKTVTMVTPVFTIGRSRSSDLQVEDPLVSRCHAELRLEQGKVFVTDKSSHGTSLNGKPVKGMVSLSPGDILEVGHFRIRYDEAGGDAEPASDVDADQAGMPSAGMSGTRVMDQAMLDDLKAEGGGEAGPEATRAVAADATRMLDPSQLPGWKAPSPAGQPTSRRFRLAGVLVGLVVAMAGLYGVMNWRDSSERTVEWLRYEDPSFGFILSYPDHWVRLTDKSGAVLKTGEGRDGGPTETRLCVYAEKDFQHELTGLTDGFLHYQEVLKGRHTGFSLLGSKSMTINEVSCIFFGFQSATAQGKGLYLLNGGTRIVVECFSSRAAYQQQAAMFSSLLQGFALREPQQVMDFPLPDDDMQHMALANPESLAQQVDQHKRNGDALVANRNVKLDNLFRAIREYQQALQLSLARPERLEAYSGAARGLQTALGLYKQAVDRQRYEISRALKEGSRETAYWEAAKLMQMVPDKADAVYQEAYQISRRLSVAK